jgi:outer membrane PBP1 activator LpoA protein
MKTILLTLCLLMLALVGEDAAAEDKLAEATDMQALQRAVQTDKRGYIASMLKLTSAEARKFWPLYDMYQRDLDASNRRRVVVVERLIVQDKPISDLYAKTLAAELLASDDTELKARRTLQARLMRALPARKAARYLQLESKVRAINAYRIADTIPIIQ